MSFTPRRRGGAEGGPGPLKRLGRVELDTGYRLQGAEAAAATPPRFKASSARAPTAWWRRRKRSGGVWRLSCARLPAAGTGPFRTRRWDAVCVLRLDAEELSCKEHL